MLQPTWKTVASSQMQLTVLQREENVEDVGVLRSACLTVHWSSLFVMKDEKPVLICWFCTFYSVRFSFQSLAKLKLFVHLNSIFFYHVNASGKKKGETFLPYINDTLTKSLISKLHMTSYQLPQPSHRVKLIYSSNPKSRGATIQTSCI